jgi:hypothetical protein
VTIHGAIKKLEEKGYKLSDFDYAVKTQAGYAFFGTMYIQPFLVNDDGIRGLNGNRKADMNIINEAAVKYEKGDYY